MDKQKPALVIMAAGMGSRFGGLKQIEPVDPEGHIIIDFSLFDSWRAGFRDVVFIIKREMDPGFSPDGLRRLRRRNAGFNRFWFGRCRLGFRFYPRFGSS